MRNCLVYIAGPISKGDLGANIQQACAVGLQLMKAGIPVIVPHLTCYMGQTLVDGNAVPEVLPTGTTHQDWYGMDIHIVRRCSAVLRLPGESTGADLEVSEAYHRGIPVFHSARELIIWAGVQQNT